MSETTKVNATIHQPTEEYGFIEIPCEGMTLDEIAKRYVELSKAVKVAKINAASN